MTPSTGTVRYWLDRSINSLREQMPEMSAYHTLGFGQKRLLLVVGAALIVGLVLQPLATGILVCALATALYMLVLSYRPNLFIRSLTDTPGIDVSDEDA